MTAVTFRLQKYLITNYNFFTLNFYTKLSPIFIFYHLKTSQGTALHRHTPIFDPHLHIPRFSGRGSDSQQHQQQHYHPLQHIKNAICVSRENSAQSTTKGQWEHVQHLTWSSSVAVPVLRCRCQTRKTGLAIKTTAYNAAQLEWVCLHLKCNRKFHTIGAVDETTNHSKWAWQNMGGGTRN